jgi:hypothetical protein
VLIFIWSVWGMVVPKASVIIAGHLKPIPVPNEIYAQKTAFANQFSQEMSQALTQKLQELQAQFDMTNMAIRQEYSKALDELRQELSDERERKLKESNEKIDRDFQLKKDAQATLAKNISRISPASALTFGATTLARTGIDDYYRFVKAAMEYKPVVTAWLNTNPNLRESGTPSGSGAVTVSGTVRVANTLGGVVNTTEQYKQIDTATLAGMPRLAIEPENLSSSVNRILPDLISMIVMIVFLMGGAYFAFIRCDVR